MKLRKKASIIGSKIKSKNAKEKSSSLQMTIKEKYKKIPSPYLTKFNN